jgi:glycine hydroxymethyltransferase
LELLHLATRGFDDAEFVDVSDIIAHSLMPNPDVSALRATSGCLTERFPLYAELGA